MRPHDEPVRRMPLPRPEQDGPEQMAGTRRGAMFDAAQSTVIAAERTSLLLSLEEQARELRSVRAAVAAARSLMPTGNLELWHGLAQLSYSIGLSRLNLDLAGLDERLADACDNTTRAIQTVRDRVG
jgi:hypothetical protein